MYKYILALLILLLPTVSKADWDYTTTFPLYNNPRELLNANTQIYEALKERRDALGSYNQYITEPIDPTSFTSYFRSQKSIVDNHREVLRQLYCSGYFVSSDIVTEPQANATINYDTMTNYLYTLKFPTNYFEYVPTQQLAGYKADYIKSIDPELEENVKKNALLKTNDYTIAGGVGNLPPDRYRWYTCDYDISKMPKLINNLRFLSVPTDQYNPQSLYTSGYLKRWSATGYGNSLADPQLPLSDIFLEAYNNLQNNITTYPNGQPNASSMGIRRLYYESGVRGWYEDYDLWEDRTVAFTQNKALFDVDLSIINNPNVPEWHIISKMTNSYGPNIVTDQVIADRFFWDGGEDWEENKYNIIEGDLVNIGTEESPLYKYEYVINTSAKPSYNFTIKYPTDFSSIWAYYYVNYVCDIIDIRLIYGYDFEYITNE